MWPQSYFLETIGNAYEETMCQYVKNQLIEWMKLKKNLSNSSTFQTYAFAAEFRV